MKYNFDKYGNVIDEAIDDDQEEFDYYYDLDDEADETPRWSEMSYNCFPMKTDWWSNDTFEPEVEEAPVQEES